LDFIRRYLFPGSDKANSTLNNTKMLEVSECDMLFLSVSVISVNNHFNQAKKHIYEAATGEEEE